jgi:hypothetical protein
LPFVTAKKSTGVKLAWMTTRKKSAPFTGKAVDNRFGKKSKPEKPRNKGGPKLLAPKRKLSHV